MASTFEQGLQWYQQGRLLRALWPSSCSASPTHLDALHLPGLIARQQGQSRRAVELLRRARAHEREPALHRNLGNALMDLGAPAEALATVERLLGSQPEIPAALCGRATALIALQRPVEAVEDCERGLAQLPSAAEVHVTRAAALLALGLWCAVSCVASLRARACATQAHAVCVNAFSPM
jgi:tetratricopeptide (TPR) repeat protein